MQMPLFLAALATIPLLSAAQTSYREWAQLDKYAADNAHWQQLPNDGKRVVFMGNSITEGWPGFDSSFFQTPGYINRGISGQTSPQMLLRFPADVLALKPAAVVILAGINDIAENTGPITLQETMDNIAAMAELAMAHNIRAVLCTVLPANKFPWRPSILPAEKVVQLNEMIRAFARQKQLPLVDYYGPMVDGEKGLQAALTYDGVHPNAEGYRAMRRIVEPVLSGLF